jgi:mono/diheme cytochrome c family protein
MNGLRNRAGPLALVALGLAQAGYTTRSSDQGKAASAPIDTAAAPAAISRDTPPAGAKPTPQAEAKPGAKVSKTEYEGWRLYSVHCARCHGQDVLPNPVAANLLISVGPGGPYATPEKFAGLVTAGRPASGMPPFKELLKPDEINAIHAYVKGRAGKRIPPGRPVNPSG